ncbi:hypothetical protein [Nonomuraea salmonea]|uniref:CopG family transcriptional regulator n=1 Tax=Nonomuraea salmonea TaxID=46181 RepID=A0ABV5NJV8_9ACTN
MDYDRRVEQLCEQGYSLTQAHRQAFAEARAALQAREEAMFDETERDR